MIQIDLITGFLGSGKTTFIKKYAAYLIKKGLHIGILENDFGAVNVDMMLLKELEGENCELEMIAGGCDKETHRRRFRTKLIAMGMSGYDRVIVEPSGIFDVDEFFDALYEEPLDQWYKIGNVIAVVDVGLEETLGEQAEYLLASEAAQAGCVVLSKTKDVSEEQIRNTIAHLNRSMESVHCSRRFGDEVICRDWEELEDADYERILASGFRAEPYEKKSFSQEDFSSLYFMDVKAGREELVRAAKQMMKDETCGKVFRVKGFFRENGGWQELNAARGEITVRPISAGQEVLIVIGEHLNKERIGAYFSHSAQN